MLAGIGALLSGVGAVGMALGQSGNKFSRKAMWSQIEGQKSYQEWLSEFNSPKNQVKRYIEAGINPNAVVGGVSSGNMSSGFSPSVPVDGDGPISRLGSVLAGLGGVISRYEAKQMAKDEIRRQDEIRDLDVAAKRLHLNILQKNLENWDLTIQAKKAGMQAPVIGEPLDISSSSYIDDLNDVLNNMPYVGGYYNKTVGKVYKTVSKPGFASRALRVLTEPYIRIFTRALR